MACFTRLVYYQGHLVFMWGGQEEDGDTEDATVLRSGSL